MPQTNLRGGSPTPNDYRRMLETLLGNLPGMVYCSRPDPLWTMIFVSEGCRDLTGYAPEDLLFNYRFNYGEVIHREDQEAVWNQAQEAVRERRTFELRYRIVTAGGSEKWVWERGRGVFGSDDELEGIEGFITDITALEQAQAAARESEEKFARTFRTLSGAMSVCEPGGHGFVEVNDGFVRMSGYSREQLIGRRALRSKSWGDRRICRATLSRKIISESCGFLSRAAAPSTRRMRREALRRSSSATGWPAASGRARIRSVSACVSTHASLG